MKFTKKTVEKLLDILAETYPEAGCELDFDSTFHLLLAVVLSAQTTDKSVNKVTPALFAKYPDPQALAEADPQEVMNLIKTIGMYRTKSANLIALSTKLVAEHDGQVPGTYDNLIALPGVGRKTANVVLAEGFGEQHIAVDTHVFRVSNRLGLVHEKDVLKTELVLMKVLPETRWTHTHHLLIFHGRYCCTARKPACDRCPVRSLCESAEADG